MQFHGQGEDGVRIYPEDYSLRINSEGVFTLEVSAANPQITGNDGKPRLVYSLPPSPKSERDEMRFVDVLSPEVLPLS